MQFARQHFNAFLRFMCSLAVWPVILPFLVANLFLFFFHGNNLALVGEGEWSVSTVEIKRNQEIQEISFTPCQVLPVPV